MHEARPGDSDERDPKKAVPAELGGKKIRGGRVLTSFVPMPFGRLAGRTRQPFLLPTTYSTGFGDLRPGHSRLQHNRVKFTPMSSRYEAFTVAPLHSA